MVYEATVTSDGRIPVPSAVRDHLDLEPGDTVRFRFDEDEGGVRIVCIPSDPRERVELARERGSSLELDAAEIL